MTKQWLLIVCICAYCNAYTPFLYPYNEHIPAQSNHSNSGVWKNFLEYQGWSEYYKRKSYDKSHKKHQNDPILQWHKEENAIKDRELFFAPNLGKEK